MDTAKLISREALSSFNKLPKAVKPIPKQQWTCFSAIVQEDENNSLRTLSMGTGTKCISESRMSPNGCVLNDSHAEVMCRRGFLRYLLQNVKNYRKSTVLELDTDTGKLKLRDGIKFHFFTTMTPCGDASIFETSDEPLSKRQKTDDGFTGAKIINNSSGDQLAQDIGCVRIKPGRGERTLSVSCSDKLAKWAVLGIQGAFLAEILLSAVYLSSITFSRDCEFDKDALERALWKRFTSNPRFRNNLFSLNVPQIFQDDKEFEFARKEDEIQQPSPTSLVWVCAAEDRQLEVAVEGMRLGVTKKNLQTKASRLKISKIELFREYLAILRKLPEIKSEYSGLDGLENLSYLEFKNKSKKYQETFKALKESYFKCWTEKPDNLLRFQVDS